MSVQLDLEVSEVNAILGVLGEMPSKSGAWPLIVKIKAQADAQLPAENADDESTEEPAE